MPPMNARSFPQAAGQIRSVTNGEGEIAYAVLPNDDGFTLYVYTGAGRLRRVSSIYEDRFATSWS